MHEHEQYLIDSKISFLKKIIKAYEIYATNGDAKTFCEANNIKYNMLLDLLNGTWGFIENSSTSPYEWLMAPIEELNLSVRPYNALKSANINTVRQILALDEKQLKSIKNMGNTSYKEVMNTIRGIGFYHYLVSEKED